MCKSKKPVVVSLPATFVRITYNTCSPEPSNQTKLAFTCGLARKCPQHWSPLYAQGHFTLSNEETLDIGQYCLPPAGKMQLLVITAKLTCTEGNFLRNLFEMVPQAPLGLWSTEKSHHTWDFAAKRRKFLFFPHVNWGQWSKGRERQSKTRQDKVFSSMGMH